MNLSYLPLSPKQFGKKSTCHLNSILDYWFESHERWRSNKWEKLAKLISSEVFMINDEAYLSLLNISLMSKSLLEYASSQKSAINIQALQVLNE